jgi:hypothetical protein
MKNGSREQYFQRSSTLDSGINWSLLVRKKLADFLYPPNTDVTVPAIYKCHWGPVAGGWARSPESAIG